MRLGVNPPLRWDKPVTGETLQLTKFLTRARHDDVPSSSLNANVNAPKPKQTDGQSRHPNSMANSDHLAHFDWSTPDEVSSAFRFRFHMSLRPHDVA